LLAFNSRIQFGQLEIRSIRRVLRIYTVPEMRVLSGSEQTEALRQKKLVNARSGARHVGMADKGMRQIDGRLAAHLRDIDSGGLHPYKPPSFGPLPAIAVSGRRSSNALAFVQTQEGPHTAVLKK